MHVAHSENAVAGGLVIRVHGDRAIIFQAKVELLEGVFRGQEADLDNDLVDHERCACRELERDGITVERGGNDLRRQVDVAAVLADASERIGLAARCLPTDEHLGPAVALKNHQGRVERGIAAADDSDALAFVVANLRNLVENLLGVELVEHGQLARKVQEANCDDHLAAQVVVFGGHDPFELVLLLHFLGILDLSQLFAETKLHERVDRLSVGALRQLGSRDSVREARNVDDTLVRVQEVGLSARALLGLDHQGRQTPMCGSERGGEASGTGTNDDYVPVREVVEVDAFFEFGDIEISHRDQTLDPEEGSVYPTPELQGS